MAWSALPPNVDVNFRVGYFYHVVANVKASHSRGDIYKIAAGRGLRIDAFDEATPSGGYRRIVVDAQALRGGSIPWAVPSPLSLFDSSSIVEAFESPPGVATPSTSTAPALPPPAPPIVVVRAEFLANIIGLIGRGLERLFGR